MPNDPQFNVTTILLSSCRMFNQLSPGLERHLWKTGGLNAPLQCVKTGTIMIKWGILQGDSLSPQLLCFPLTNMLNKQGLGYAVNKQHSISHPLYMDTLKLFTKDEHQLEQALVTIKAFSDDIKIEFGLDKCTVLLQSSRLAKLES